jgi:hypothetical protein
VRIYRTVVAAERLHKHCTTTVGSTDDSSGRSPRPSDRTRAVARRVTLPVRHESCHERPKDAMLRGRRGASWAHRRRWCWVVGTSMAGLEWFAASDPSTKVTTATDRSSSDPRRPAGPTTSRVDGLQVGMI